MSLYKPVTHCVFDMDGLLFNTEPIYEDSVREICRSFGKEYPFDVRMKVMGTTEYNTAEITIKELSLPLTVPEFLIKLENLVAEEFKKVKMMKGADRLIRHLHKHNIPFCVASSACKEMGAIKWSGYPDLYKLFSHFVYGSSDSEVKKGKPAPDIFLIAASRFEDKPDPTKCLVFEDSPNGVKAAVAANMQSVMVPDASLPIEKRAEATIVINSLEDFQPELFGLPAFTD
ncbi:probable pseudouridine-5'-phosphatase [Contarinia nasturtii]|uniref:probable pseudouridine-5'-phosphatase n=1 Tax=Contarinia nasturtii TaxID=265458 RepID=UPI0012D46F3E|nr:probable pseudouridine-5'-phosphatase [Contarinia nasturtii]